MRNTGERAGIALLLVVVMVARHLALRDDFSRVAIDFRDHPTRIKSKCTIELKQLIIHQESDHVSEILVVQEASVAKRPWPYRGHDSGRTPRNLKRRQR